MISSPSIKASAKGYVQIMIHELNQLLFWASVGTKSAKGGSYYPAILGTIQEWEGRLKHMDRPRKKAAA